MQVRDGAPGAARRRRMPASKERLGKLEKELADLKEKSAALKAQWQNEKDVVDESRKVQEELEAARNRTGTGAAHRRSRHGRARSSTATSPSSKRSWKRRNSCGELQEVRQLAARRKSPRKTSPRWWPAGPASRSADCRKARREKLVKMEERLRARHRPGGGHHRGVAMPCAARGRLAGPESSHRLIHFSRPDRRGQDRD